MSKAKFRLNRKAVGDLLKSDQMQKVLENKATEIRNRCGDGYEQDIFIGKNRANTMVAAKSFKAKKDNLKNNTLLKAVH